MRNDRRVENSMQVSPRRVAIVRVVSPSVPEK